MLRQSSQAENAGSIPVVRSTTQPLVAARRGDQDESNVGPQFVVVPPTGPEAICVAAPGASIRSRESAIARSHAAVACW